MGTEHYLDGEEVVAILQHHIEHRRRAVLMHRIIPLGADVGGAIRENGVIRVDPETLQRKAGGWMDGSMIGV